LNNVANIDEYATQFDQFDLKVEEEIKGFDPNQLFMKHMIYVGYSVSYENTFLFGEEEDEDKNPEAFLLKILTLLLVPMNHIGQHGRVVNERSTHSPNVSQRSDPQKKILSQ
jgi:hypothetical protein